MRDLSALIKAYDIRGIVPNQFDPDGAYIRRFVPELAKLSAKHLHDPSSAPTMELQLAGIELGKDYPAAIVDLKQTRERALAAYKTLRD